MSDLTIINPMVLENKEGGLRAELYFHEGLQRWIAKMIDADSGSTVSSQRFFTLASAREVAESFVYGLA